VATMAKEKEYIKKELDRLPPDLVREVIDFIEFLRNRKEKMKWIEFDEWAVNLAKKKKFNKLTEKEVVAIVKSHRKSFS